MKMGINDSIVNGVVNSSNSSILLKDFIKTSFWENAPPEISKIFFNLMSILKIAGIVFIIYIIFLILKAIYSLRTTHRINVTYKKVLEIDKKLNDFLENKNKSKSEINTGKSDNSSESKINLNKKSKRK